MTTTATTTTPTQGQGPAPVAPRPPRQHPPIPTGRLVAVELRKMFDTRAGFWLTASIAILSLVATGAVVAFAPDEAVTYESLATAVGGPKSVILPKIAIL